MADPMKFGPEWLRNISGDKFGDGDGSGSNPFVSGSNTSMTTSLMPPSQQPEFRYGREEMLSLCEKASKSTEIFHKFKNLYVEKKQLPLALSPSAEDENVYQFPSRRWQMRSPVNLIPPPTTKGYGFANSERCRPRIFTSVACSARTTSDNNTRVTSVKGVMQGLPERNGGNDIGYLSSSRSPTATPCKQFKSEDREAAMENWRRRRVNDESRDEWNESPAATPCKELKSDDREVAMYNWRRSRVNDESEGEGNESPSVSPRKEVKSHDRKVVKDSWRRSRVNDDCGEGWQSAVGQSSGSSYRGTRSNSWRNEDSTNPFLNNAGDKERTADDEPLGTSSFRRSSNVGRSTTNTCGNVEQINSPLNSNQMVYKSLQQDSDSPEAINKNNPFYDSTRTDESNNDVHNTYSWRTSKKKPRWYEENIPEWAMEDTTEGAGSFDCSGVFHVRNDEQDESVGSSISKPSQQSSELFTEAHKARPVYEIENVAPKDKLDQRLEVEAKATDSLEQELEEIASKSTALRKRSKCQQTISLAEAMDLAEEMVYKSLQQDSDSPEAINRNNPFYDSTRTDESNNDVHNTYSWRTSKKKPRWYEENIPEWAMEDTTEGAGSFDSSGVFHVRNEQDESVGSSISKPSQQSSELFTEAHKARPVYEIENVAPKDKLDQRLEVEAKATDSLEQEPEEIASKSPALRKRSNCQQTISLAEAKLTQSQVETSSSIYAPDIMIPARLQRFERSPSTEGTAPKLETFLSITTGASQAQPVTLSSELKNPKNTVSDLADRMREFKMLIENESTSAASPAGSSCQSHLLTEVTTPNSSKSVMNPSPQQLMQVHNHSVLNPAPQPQPESSGELWYYCDPRNIIQGPFTGTEMVEWYRSGYFDENLFVRRTCDSRFVTLSELLKIYGTSMPFSSSHLIPPSEIASVRPLSNHLNSLASSEPPPVNINQSNPINRVKNMLETNEIAPWVSTQLEYLQKEYLLQQQNLIFSKLSASKKFTLLCPEWQQYIVQQQMKQVLLPGDIANLPAFINCLRRGYNTSPFSTQQMMPGSCYSSVPPNIDLRPVETPNFHNLFDNSSRHRDSSVMQISHNLNHGANAGQPIVQTPAQLLHYQHTTNRHDAIELLLHRNKTTKAIPQNVGNVYPQNPIPGMQHMPWLSSNGGNTSVPVGMRDFDPLISSISAGIQSDIKTEQQIIEEQRQQRLHLLQTPHHPLPPPTQSQMNNQPEVSTTDLFQPPETSTNVLTQSNSSTQVENTSLVQHHTSQTLMQQHDRQEWWGTMDDKTSKSAQIENTKSSKTRLWNSEKKDSISCQKSFSVDGKKGEAAEMLKKQIEDQQKLLEEAKHRQMLDEKKRQEEIACYRRAKMLEYFPPKFQKQYSDSFSNTSSATAWSNFDFSGITTPAKSFAEIQKAEQERKTVERSKLVNERKVQQVEMQSKVEPTVAWSAPSINVKSLAEIQGEEFKQQQQIAYEQAVTAEVQRKRKANLTSSSQHSVWSSWNSKFAPSSTSNVGFWEEPVRNPATTGNIASGTSASSKPTNPIPVSASPRNNGNSMPGKSETFSNIPMSGVQNASSGGGCISSNEIKNTSNATGPTDSRAIRGGTSSAKQTKVSASNSGGQSGPSAVSDNQKDDAQNEFTSWCIKILSSIESTIDVPTFIQFLQEIESPYEVKEYVGIYLGETKETTEFAKQFLERRSKYKNQQRTQNTYIDAMCSPALAINPPSNDFQEVKYKGRKLKKSKMIKLDATILGFTVTKAQDQIHRSEGISQSSSSSSRSSSASSSPSPQRHRRSHHRTNRSSSRSPSSSDASSRSRSKTRSRSRSPVNRQSKKRVNRDEDESNDVNMERMSHSVPGTFGDKDLSSDASSDRHHADDSIRSDQSSKMTTNGGNGSNATSQSVDSSVAKRTNSAIEAGSLPKLTQPKILTGSRYKGIQFGKPGTVVRPGIQMKLAQPRPPSETTKKITVASAFNNDSDEEVEEMPPECKMRMRNIGRDTPTSSGPNSFGKTKQGFIDSKKLFEKSLREAAME